MNSLDVKSSTYIDFGIENNDEDSKFEVGDGVRISKHQNIFFIVKKNCKKPNQTEFRVEKVIK